MPLSLATGSALSEMGPGFVGSARTGYRLSPAAPLTIPFDIDAEVDRIRLRLLDLVGQNRVEPMILTADQVAHYSPIPDP